MSTTSGPTVGDSIGSSIRLLSKISVAFLVSVIAVSFNRPAKARSANHILQPRERFGAAEDQHHVENARRHRAP